MATKEALKAIQEAAFAIQADRKRLNNAFASLREAAKSLNPGVELLDDGSIIDKTKSVGEQITPIWDVLREAEPDVVGEPVAKEEEPVPEPTVEIIRDHEPVVVVVADLRNEVEKFILKTSPTRPSALDQKFLPITTIPQLNAVVQGLARDGIIKRTTAGHWVHKDYSPKVTEPPPDPTTRGSGLRKDTVPGSSSTSAPRERQTSTSTGLTSSTAGQSPSSPSPEAKSSAVPPTRPATSGSTTSSLASAKNADGTYGVAHAPIPLSEMKQQRREAEERLVTIIAWAQDKGDRFDVLTAAKELGGETSLKQTATKSLYLKSFLTLKQRGVFKQTGREIQPNWKPRTKSMGRGTKEYTWGPNSPKAVPTLATTQPVSDAASPPPSSPPAEGLRKLRTPTPEETRDAAVELKQVTLYKLLRELDLQGTPKQRATVKEHMATMTLRKMFTALDGGWEYIPPTDAGAAATVDRARRPIPVERATANAVTGTGRGKRAGDPEVQRIMDAARRKWGDTAVEFLSKHIRIKLPGGGSVTISHTPNQRGLLRDKARLRKAGLALA